MAKSVKVAKKKITASSLEIKNFKSIKHLKINTSRINVFVGKPNSGKSNLLEALTLFNFIQEKKDRNTQPTFIRYNSLDNLFYDRNPGVEIEITLNNNLALFKYHNASNTFLQFINPSPEFLKSKDLYFSKGLSLYDIKQKVPFINNKPDSKKYSSKFSNYQEPGVSIGDRMNSNSNENPVRRYEFFDGTEYGNRFGSYLIPNGENLFTIVNQNPKIRNWINSFFEEYNLEFLIDFTSKNFEIQKKEKGIVYKIPFELTPDTFRRMLFHVAAIYSNKNATILFEEPESHSFPPYIKELSELIKEDKSNNYFITTHSPYFLNSMIEDSKTFKDISFFHVYYEDFQTKIKQLTQKELDNIWGNGTDVFFNIDSFGK